MPPRQLRTAELGEGRDPSGAASLLTPGLTGKVGLPQENPAAASPVP